MESHFFSPFRSSAYMTNKSGGLLHRFRHIFRERIVFPMIMIARLQREPAMAGLARGGKRVLALNYLRAEGIVDLPEASGSEKYRKFKM